MEKKQLKNSAVRVNGLRKNCFVRDISTDTFDSPKNATMKSYSSLEKIDLPTGFYYKLVEKDYPINSDSISSYADGADYRCDPLSAIAAAPKRVNLGDISEVQRFLRDNPMEAARQYKDILKKVEIFVKAYQENADAVAPDTDENKGENK